MLNVAEIDLKILRQNAINIKNFLPSGVKFCAVVKADAYGHGAETVANAIHDLVDFFAVALYEEAYSLRLAGVTKEILVLTPPKNSDIKKAIENGITFCVQDALDIIKIQKVASRLKKTATVQIALNTGMNRLGANADEVLPILQALEKSPKVILTGAYSHFYNAKSKNAREKQKKIFGLMLNKIKEKYPNITAHISASGGVLNGEFYDAVRIGIMLYGYYPYKIKKPTIKIRPVMKVYTFCVKERLLSAGENLLYGNFKLKNKEEISLIRFGYADGLSRNSKKLTLNKRCMDLSAVKKANKTRKFYILNKNADEIAKKYDTISYEILTSVSRRTEKIYLR